jgi:glycopeptide antibiotics resistance protein
MKLSKRTLNWLITSYVLAIMVLSVVAINSNKQINLSSTWVLSIRSDYLLHTLLFIPWMVLISWRWNKMKGAGFFIKAMGAGLLLATVSEVIQLFIPARAFNPVDLLANCIGIMIGALIMKWGRAKRVVSSQ